MGWLTEYLLSRKPGGTICLFLDGHAPHKNHPNILQVASDNDNIILCLRRHTAHYLQLLNLVAFNPFQTYFKDACENIITHRGYGVQDE